MKGAWVTAGLLQAAVAALMIGSVVATMHVSGVSLREACWAVIPGIGWVVLTFACGWWMAARHREKVSAEVTTALAPVLKELKHLRGALAQRVDVDEFAKTTVHPCRIAPASDDARTVVVSYHRIREAIR